MDPQTQQAPSLHELDAALRAIQNPWAKIGYLSAMYMRCLDARVRAEQRAEQAECALEAIRRQLSTLSEN